MKFVQSLLLSVFILLSFSAFSKSYEWKSKEDSKKAQEKAAGCAPATELVLMNYNNVRALIETGGNMWQDRATSRAFYRVPAEGNLSVIYAGALWMGGITPGSRQLKTAAVTFRQDGNDYWPGPLTTDGTAEIEADQCQEYDKFFLTERTWSVQHRAYFDCFYNPDCNPDEEMPGYIIPSEFYSYPAHGNPALGQSFYLAPFYDYAPPGEEPDGIYNPDDGDHPWYDIDKEIDCSNKQRTDPIPLYGDQNYWWVFNDKGNVHSESGGTPIGMEIQAQAFAFATNDEINNMTFYNYTLINRGTLTLEETYFGQWVDADVGAATDDYVGCDVQRGLGFAYNGPDFDGPNGYGDNPPAVGVDFFEGPFQDYDQIDNAGPEDNLEPISYDEAVASDGIPYKGLGIGYGDDIVDNERFGMRKFLYYNNNPGADNGDPQTDVDHYNYLTGYWKNNQRMTYGGDGFNFESSDQPADFMFPGNTDQVGFGTDGLVQEEWSESVEASDRRFIQSAGPFTLLPGDYNNITVGVIYARASGGGPLASVDLLKQADDKAQALFDNCFNIVSGPTAPDVAYQELDQEVILYLSNADGAQSNNSNETFHELDPTIPDRNTLGEILDEDQKKYKFQGYQVYQLANDQVSVDELDQQDKARLIKTMDIEDGITNIVNYELDGDGLVIPTLMANGTDSGIEHSLSITQDEFAASSKTLINYKTYYFLVMAYAHNEYEPYNTETRTGQNRSYLASRNSSSGAIKTYSVIPHPPETEANGTQFNVSYGDGIPLTRLEGKGNGSLVLDISAETEDEIMSGSPWRAEKTIYQEDASPVNVKVIDPLALQSIDFELKLAPGNPALDENSLFWELTDLTNGISILADKPIQEQNEQLFSEYGISIEWNQYTNPIPELMTEYAEPIASSIEFEDQLNPWLIPFPDIDGLTDFNWIRSGAFSGGDEASADERTYDDYGVDPGPDPNPNDNYDPDELYEQVANGMAAPYVLCSYSEEAEFGGTLISAAPTSGSYFGNSLSILNFNKLNDLNNVDIVLTPKKELWTRCPVLEMQSNINLIQTHPALSSYSSDGEKMNTRRHPSVDKNGKHVGQNGYNSAQGDFNGDQPEGMGWFPGYAIDLDTGERLNMAFGEDSWLGTENGRDMIWNPTSNFGPNGSYAGGQHWIYVFRNSSFSENDDDAMPGYDEGYFSYDRLINDNNGVRDVLQSCTWVSSAILAPGSEFKSATDGFIPNTARIKLRLAKAYQKFSAEGQNFNSSSSYSESANNWNPLYEFSTSDIATRIEQLDILEDELASLNVVPNPYYAFSQYEESKIDNRVKVINLPYECTVSIYDLAGTLVRQYQKSDETTFLDWDLKNSTNIPIASGIYLIHVKTDAGERVLKWFGVMRPVDLDAF